MDRPPVRYFKVRLGRMTVGELCRACKWNPIAMALVLPAKIGLQILSLPYAAVRSEWIHLTPKQVPRRSYDRMCDHIDILEEKGFEITAWGETPLLEDGRELYVSLLWHPDGNIGAAVLDLVEPLETITACIVSSRSEDGKVYGTSNERRIFNMPPEFHVDYFLGKPAEWILNRHRDLMDELEDAGVKWRQFQRDEGPKRSVQYDAVFRDYLVERGVLVELDEDTIDDLWEAKRER